MQSGYTTDNGKNIDTQNKSVYNCMRTQVYKFKWLLSCCQQGDFVEYATTISI